MVEESPKIESKVEEGESFGPYILQRSLGLGGMAHVYKALLPVAGHSFGKELAIKRILPCFTEERAFVDLLMDEARLTMRIAHPNVAQTFNIGQIDGAFFLAMEFIDGLSLDEVIKQFRESERKIPTDLAVCVAMQVAAGLHAAHELRDAKGEKLNVIHRDLSPRNIMVDRHGVAKLIDFGVAKAKARLVETTDGSVRGTMGYFSPERADGDPFDHRADIFGLGLVLWTSLAGKHPLEGMGQMETLMALQQWSYPPIAEHRDDIPESLDLILQRALAFDPEDRYSCAEALRADLARHLYGRNPAFSTLEVARLLDPDASLEPDSEAMSVEPKEAKLAPDKVVKPAEPWVSERPTLLRFPEEEREEAVSERPTQLNIDIDLPRTQLPERRLSRMGLRAITLRSIRAVQARAQGHGAYWVLFGLLFFTLLMVGIALSLSPPEGEYEHNPSAAAPSKQPVAQGELELDSSPRGAEIFWNGVSTGSRTPALLELPQGRGSLELRRQGYEARVLETEIQANRRRLILLELEAAKIDVELSLDEAITAVLVFPELGKRFLSFKGAPVLVEGLRVGERYRVVALREGEEPETYTFVPNPDQRHAKLKNRLWP